MSLSFDTETALIRPGVNAPELVCVSFATNGLDPAANPDWRNRPAYLLNKKEGPELFRELLRSDQTLSGHNLAFDALVMMANDPSVAPLVFRAYEENRTVCTQARAVLLDIAAGCHRGEFTHGVFRKYKYNLDDLSQRFTGWKLDKDTWRLRYFELIDTPLPEWPVDAQNYPLDDARATASLFDVQEVHKDFLLDQHRMSRRHLWLKLRSGWGMRTNPFGVEKFAKQVESEIGEVQRRLQEWGFVRADGSRDTKKVRKYVLGLAQSHNIEVEPTKTAKAKIKAGKDPGFENGEGISLSADALEALAKETGDPYISSYGEFGVLKAVQSKDLVMLASAAEFPVHTNFGFADTGRVVSSKPNIMNVRKLPGIRECFVPRQGWLFISADYPGLELKTLAQACIDLIGESRLGQVLNSGMDPHLMMASTIMRRPYDETKTLYKSGDKEAKRARDLAKIANFGFPGGLGALTLIEFARGYKTIIDEERARQLKKEWLVTWPEMRDFFAYVSKLVEAGGSHGAFIKQPRSERFRGRVRYTAACNNYFQAPGADATGEVGWHIARAQYLDTASPLYGVRGVNFIHDEFLEECPYKGEQLTRAALELCRIMRDVANRWLPDVPFEKIEPVAMEYWSKDAVSLFDEYGQLHAWNDQRCEYGCKGKDNETKGATKIRQGRLICAADHEAHA